jgi:hypothetical protein
MAYKKLRRNRPIERETANAIRTFLDGHNIPFQEVGFDVDYGKDFYVEISSPDGVTGRMIAIQAKGGAQTFRTRLDGTVRGVPYDADDATVFRESNVPVLGMTDDKERRKLLWVNLTEHCASAYEASGADHGGFAIADNELDDYRLQAFVREMLLLTGSSRDEIVLDLASDVLDRQRSAIYDCFGLGLRDSRPLLLVRRALAQCR